MLDFSDNPYNIVLSVGFWLVFLGIIGGMAYLIRKLIKKLNYLQSRQNKHSEDMKNFWFWIQNFQQEIWTLKRQLGSSSVMGYEKKKNPYTTKKTAVTESLDSGFPQMNSDFKRPNISEQLISDYNKALVQKDLATFQNKYDWERGDILNVSERLKDMNADMKFGPSQTGDFIIVKHQNQYYVFPYWALDMTETVKDEMSQLFQLAEVAGGRPGSQFKVSKPALFELQTGTWEMAHKGELTVFK